MVVCGDFFPVVPLAVSNCGGIDQAGNVLIPVCFQLGIATRFIGCVFACAASGMLPLGLLSLEGTCLER